MIEKADGIKTYESTIKIQNSFSLSEEQQPTFFADVFEVCFK